MDQLIIFICTKGPPKLSFDFNVKSNKLEFNRRFKTGKAVQKIEKVEQIGINPKTCDLFINRS